MAKPHTPPFEPYSPLDRQSFSYETVGPYQFFFTQFRVPATRRPDTVITSVLPNLYSTSPLLGAII